MNSLAVLLKGPKALVLESVDLCTPGPSDIVVDITHSGISTGTEKLLWTGDMPPFPGLGYPLVPGYEAAGEVVEAGAESGFRAGDRVFVPGANCYDGARGIFGAASSRLVSDASRVTRVDPALGAEGALLALAATARHAIVGPHAAPPDLIVGHGVLGRLIARQTIAAGHPAPTVWEVNAERRSGADGYEVIDPDTDERRDYGAVYDASGDGTLLDSLIGRIAKGGEVVLAGFYAAPLTFAFPPAFMKEARLRIAAEWTRDDLDATSRLIADGVLSLDGLITHSSPAVDAATAYPRAFDDPACLKMILDWTHTS